MCLLDYYSCQKTILINRGRQIQSAIMPEIFHLEPEFFCLLKKMFWILEKSVIASENVGVLFVPAYKCHEFPASHKFINLNHQDISNQTLKCVLWHVPPLCAILFNATFCLPFLWPMSYGHFKDITWT